jgi:hypothetical protein
VSSYTDVIAGIQIFLKYPHEDEAVYAGHDILYAGPPPSSVTDPDDILKLQAAGWFPNDNDDGYQFFT